jgi:hypothetical protein
MIAVIQAHKDGKQIEVRGKVAAATWGNRHPDATLFNFASFEYRVKPEPRRLFVIENSVGSRMYSRTTREDAEQKLTHINSRRPPNNPARIVEYVEVLK